MPGYSHKNPQAMCSSWIYYVFLTARTSLTFHFLPPWEVFAAIAFAAVMEATQAGSLVLLKRLGALCCWFPFSESFNSLITIPHYLFPGGGDEQVRKAWPSRFSTPTVCPFQLLFMKKKNASPCNTEYGFYYGVWGHFPPCNQGGWTILISCSMTLFPSTLL